MQPHVAMFKVLGASLLVLASGWTVGCDYRGRGSQTVRGLPAARGGTGGGTGVGTGGTGVGMGGTGVGTGGTGGIGGGIGGVGVTDGGRTGATGDGGAPCVGSISEVEAAAGHPISASSACPSTYGDAMRNPVACGPASPFATVTFGRCGSALVMSSNCVLHGFVCVYDPTTQALVGAASFEDVLRYCNNTSSCIVGGVLPAEISCTAEGLRLSCVLGTSDGGLADGSDK